MYSCISIGGNEEQQEACKKEIQRMIGITAGVGNEYKEQDNVWNPLAQMRGLFSGAMDMTQLNKFMQSTYMGVPMGMQPPGEVPMQQPPAYAPQQPVPQPAPVIEPSKEGEEAPPGMEEEEDAPPGLYYCLF